MWDHAVVKPTITNAQSKGHSGRRYRPAGVLTSGGRLTLLALISGLMLLAQAWQVAHRYGQHRDPVAVQTVPVSQPLHHSLPNP